MELLIRHGVKVESKSWNSGQHTIELETLTTRLLLHATHDLESSPHGIFDTVATLLKYGAKIDQRFENSTLLNKLLTKEPTQNVLDVANFMLDHGVDVNGPREMGRLVHRPIHLVLRSADERLPSKSWFKATRRSSSKMGLQLLKRLLDLGPDPNCTDGNGDTLLTYACRSPLEVDGREVIKILLNDGADVNGVSSTELNLLHTILQQSLPFKDSRGPFQTISESVISSAATDFR